MFIPDRRRCYKAVAHSSRRPMEIHIKDPDELARIEAYAVLRAKKKFRIMRTYTLPYWRYYEAQVTRDSSIFKKIVEEAKNVCFEGQRIVSEGHLRKDQKLNKKILENCTEYLRLKKQIEIARYRLQESIVLYKRCSAVIERNRKNKVCRKSVKDENVNALLIAEPRLMDQLHVVTNNANRHIARASAERRDTASVLSIRMIQRERFQQAQNHLHHGKLYLMEILDQALVAFRSREDSLAHFNRAKEHRAMQLQYLQRSLNILSIRLNQAKSNLKFYTKKSQHRISNQSDYNVKTENYTVEEERRLKQYLEDTNALVAQIFCSFHIPDINKMTKALEETRANNLHTIMYLLYPGSLVCDLKFKVEHYDDIFLELHKTLKAKEVERKIVFQELKSQLTFLKAVLDLYRQKTEVMNKTKEHYFIYFSKMFTDTPMNLLLNGIERWDTLNTLEEALEKLEYIAVQALAIYKAKNASKYCKPYTVDKVGKIQIPKDPRLRQRTLNILLEKKKLADKFKVPISPCLLCIQASRTIEFSQVTDTIRSRKFFEDKVNWLLKNAENYCLHTKGMCHPGIGKFVEIERRSY